jgi:glycosyltransferase involved in cell wall biosynthesis
MRLLYLYPEEWQGHRAREVHTLSTCLALARAGLHVTLLTAGGLSRAQEQVQALAGEEVPGLRLAALTRGVGPIRSIVIFSQLFRMWLPRQPRYDAGFAIHLKAATLLKRAALPYLYEAHEVFAETPQKTSDRHQGLREMERAALTGAAWRVATSKALANALRAHYELPNDFSIVPNAGPEPLAQSVAEPDGPFVYAGSIADWKGLELVINASQAAGMPLKIIGGTAEEWASLQAALPTGHVNWQPRVAPAELPAALAGTRAGLVSTRPDSPSGRYSCPMKLFDYARCGLPVLSTALPSLDSLDAGSWCARVPAPTVAAWTTALRDFRPTPVLGETARAWAGVHTWAARAEKIARILRH